MYITSVNHSNTPQFRSRFIETLRKPAKLNAPLDKMTRGDCHRLALYLQSLKFRLGMTQQEVNKILSKNGIEFLQNIATFFSEKLDFSENNMPPIFFVEGAIGNAQAAYSPEQNVVFLTNEYEKIPKHQLFGLLRHEYQHAIQNQNILRTEFLGEEAVEFYTNKSFEAQKPILLDYATNYSIKELVAQGIFDTNGAILISELSYALQNDDKATIDNILIKFKQALFNGLNDFRKKLLQEKGLIKSGTKQAEIARKYFEDFKNIDYYDKNGLIDIGKHSTKLIEIEAEQSQLMAESEINRECFIRTMKNNLEELSKNKDYLESIDRELYMSQND